MIIKAKECLKKNYNRINFYPSGKYAVNLPQGVQMDHVMIECTDELKQK
ncbi:MAG: hypothetical protein J5965_13820 [Aeriscardovia sp.]|nr:hypothetical protein [Aeriscardovia sp.]